jgi:two-component system, NarL family, nitrate/nitrite response regulator NarL
MLVRDDPRGDDVVRVVVVSDVPLYREGIAQILSATPSVEVSRTVTIEALARLDAPDPDVALVDLTAGGGVAAVRAARDVLPDARVVALGVLESEAELLPLVEAGVAGYVSSGASSDELVDAVRSAARGECLASPRIVGGLMRHVAALAGRRGSSQGALPRLTSREREILGLIEQGLSNKEIARRLVIEVTTVKNHVHNILEKLGVTRRGEAAALARGRLGLPALGRAPI